MPSDEDQIDTMAPQADALADAGTGSPSDEYPTEDEIAAAVTWAAGVSEAGAKHARKLRRYHYLLSSSGDGQWLRMLLGYERKMTQVGAALNQNSAAMHRLAAAEERRAKAQEAQTALERQRDEDAKAAAAEAAAKAAQAAEVAASRWVAFRDSVGSVLKQPGVQMAIVFLAYWLARELGVDPSGATLPGNGGPK